MAVMGIKFIYVPLLYAPTIHYVVCLCATMRFVSRETHAEIRGVRVFFKDGYLSLSLFS